MLEDLTIDALMYGSYAWLGLLAFIIMGLIAIKLNRFAGVFVFIIAMLYEIQLYGALDIYGNNIWYMIIVLIFAVFSAWSVFDTKTD